ncbi:uncharacterized protein J3D65DRAFT_612626 [Phyllosticta citribraziliensis]|uniref:Uncharacterized protein n=1 Tax=Phyllosticta citribraziliensis TaxID=989973 RepID=A0ABR1M577_9PEZI
MPPKRTRAAQTRNSRATTASDATSTTDKRSGTHARHSVAQIDGASDGDARRVRAAARNGRTARGQEEELDFTMTGALGIEYAPAHKTSPPAQKTPAPARPRGRLGRKVVRNDTQTQALEALKRRMAEEQVKKTGEKPSAPISAAAALAARKKKRTSGASTDDSVAVESPAPGPVQRVGQTEESSPAVAPVSPPRGRQRQVVPSSAVKAQGTPMAENSVLALSKFKRRPRQPSILRMVGATSDVENNDNDDDDTEDLTLNYSLGDFEPDHESTPLHLQKSRKSQGQSSEARTGSSRKRKFQELDFEQNETSEVQVPASSPPVLSQTYLMESDSSSEHLYSEPDELPERVPDTQEQAPGHEDEPLREATPEIYSETQAPPKSTSSVSHRENPEDRPEAIPNRRSRRQPQRVKATQDDPDSSSSDSDNDIETTVRTRKRTTRSKSSKPKSKSNNQRALTTSALASLLPRRRRAQRNRGNTEDPFEIPSSESNDVNTNRQDNVEVQELSSDEDELLHDPPPRQRGKSTARGKGKQPADSTRRKGKANNDAAAQRQRGAGRPSMTYGRSRVSSDKENQNADGQDADRRNNSDEGGDVGQELTKVAQKFAEIDKWEMEFESVSAENGAASSPWR